MRGIDYFNQEDEREWCRTYDRYVISWQTRQTNRDFGTQPISRAEYDAAYAHVCNENDYHQWRERQDLAREGTRVFWKGIDPLNIDGLSELVYDRPRLQPFKMKYDTIDEVRMRFHKTVILVKGNPFHVSDERHIKNDFYLLLEGMEKKAYVSVNDIPDLRPAHPGYVKIGETNGYFKRLPARVNQQGMTNQTVQITRVGSRDGISFNTSSLVEALSVRGKVLPWDKSYRRLIDDRIVSTFRLSDNIALYTKPNQSAVIVEYKGRRLGNLEDHTVKVFDEDDVIQSWVRKDINQVNLEIGS